MQVVYLDFSKAALEVAKARAEVLNPTTKNKTMKKGIQITNNNLKGIVHNFFLYRSWDLDSNQWRRESRSPALQVEVPCGAASRGPWGQNENPKMLSFGRL